MNRRGFLRAFTALASGLIVPEKIGAFLAPRKTQIVVPERTWVGYMNFVYMNWKNADEVTVRMRGYSDEDFRTYTIAKFLPDEQEAAKKIWKGVILP